MSTYETWQVYCEDCQEYVTDFRERRGGVQTCQTLIKFAHAIAVLGAEWKDMQEELGNNRLKIQGDFGNNSWEYEIEPENFAKHYQHKLVVQRGSGQRDGECNAYVNCPECKGHTYCVLDPNHTGDHSHKRVAVPQPPKAS